MRAALGVLLFVALAALLCAHLVIAVALVRRRQFARAALALFLPPLAPLWALENNLRSPAFAWLAAFAVYAVGVALA